MHQLEVLAWVLAICRPKVTIDAPMRRGGAVRLRLITRLRACRLPIGSGGAIPTAPKGFTACRTCCCRRTPAGFVPRGQAAVGRELDSRDQRRLPEAPSITSASADRGSGFGHRQSSSASRVTAGAAFLLALAMGSSGDRTIFASRVTWLSPLLSAS
jgi:hypothetical protein